MRDLCDVAQVLWLDQVERQFLADRALAGTLAAAGVVDVESALTGLGTLDDARDHFIDVLRAPLHRSPEDERTAVILAALGAGHGR